MPTITNQRKTEQFRCLPHRRANLTLCLTSTKVLCLPRHLALLLIFYADRHGDNITTDGTIQLCQDLAVDPEDVVLLAVAYELKSPGMAEWTRQGWIDGWKSLGYVLLVVSHYTYSVRGSVVIIYPP